MSLQPVPIQNVPGVPDYTCTAFLPKNSDYCLLIPVIRKPGWTVWWILSSATAAPPMAA